MQVHAQDAGREPGSIRLVCVSKTFPATAIRAAYGTGQREFGENYLQEALAKIEALSDLDLCWHFIGQIQSNKTAAIATHFDWAHALDRARIARRLSNQRPAGRAPLNVCLQVNISGETGKGGLPASEEAIRELAGVVAGLPGLALRGLMAVPAADAGQVEQQFAQMQALYLQLRGEFPAMDTLSMGMSGDYPLALRYGATMIRVGRAIFGERTYDAGRDD